ncbi:MAG: RidA family protein [Mycobacteriales bacterium]
MAREGYVSDRAPKPAGPYSHAIVANGFLYTAGLGPIDPATGEKVGTTIEEQTAAVMDALVAVLGERGLDFSDVVKSTVHLAVPKRDFAGFNTVYQTYLSPPFPVRTTVGSELADILVEIDVVAALRD